MKPNHYTNILDDFMTKGILYRDDLMNNRSRYGLHFDRRIREIDLLYKVEREWSQEGERYIKAWVYLGPKDDCQMNLELTG